MLYAPPYFGRSENGGATLLLAPPDFQTFRHPCCKNIFQREDSSSRLYPVHNELLLFLQRSYFNERKQPAKIGNKTNYYNTLFKNLELFLGWMDSLLEWDKSVLRKIILSLFKILDFFY